MHFKEPNGRPGCDFIGLNYYRCMATVRLEHRMFCMGDICLCVCIETNGGAARLIVSLNRL